MSIGPQVPSNRLVLCCPLLLLLSIFASIRVFSNRLSLHIRWPKFWCFSFNISPSNDYSGLISFKTDWFDHIVVQGTLSSFLHHHSSKASILGCSAFFRAELSHLYRTTGKTTVLTIRTFVSKVMSLLVNTLSRFVITFLPRRKCLLISWWQSLSTVIFEQKKRLPLFPCFPYLSAMKSWDQILGCWTLSFKPAFSLFSFTFIERFFSSTLHIITVTLKKLKLNSSMKTYKTF